MIIFLYGEDTFRSRQKLRQIKNKFLREIDPSGNSLILLNGEKVSMEKINEMIAATSLLAKKRMVIIENLFANKNEDIFTQLYSYLKAKGERQNDNILVFWDEVSTKEVKISKSREILFKFLAKQKYVQEFEPLSNSEATKWAVKEIKARGGKISHQVAQLLTGLLGSSLWQISNEINKLINYKQAQQSGMLGSQREIIIEIKDVEELVQGNFDENIFALTDAISNKNRSLALNLLDEQSNAGLTEGYLFAMIMRQFRVLLQIREALDSGLTSRKVINFLGFHPFVVQKGIIQVRRFSSQFLKNIINQLVKVDYLIKTGQIDFRTALDLLIIKLG